MLKMMKIVLLFNILVLTVMAMTCGENCPDRQCLECYCGNQASYISVSDYCSISDKWNQNCCKCIVARTSKGNQNYMFTISFWSGLMAVGTLPLQPSIANGQYCEANKVQDLCNYKINSKCAHALVTENGTRTQNWKIWRNHALACGCPVEQNNLSHQNIV